MGMVCPYCGTKFDPAIQGYSPLGDDYIRSRGASLAAQQLGQELGRRASNAIGGSLTRQAPTKLYAKNDFIYCSKKCFREDTADDTPEEAASRAEAIEAALAAERASAEQRKAAAEAREPYLAPIRKVARYGVWFSILSLSSCASVCGSVGTSAVLEGEGGAAAIGFLGAAAVFWFALSGAKAGRLDDHLSPEAQKRTFWLSFFTTFFFFVAIPAEEVIGEEVVGVLWLTAALFLLASFIAFRKGLAEAAGEAS